MADSITRGCAVAAGALALAVLFIVSCSDAPRNADGAVRALVRAHGGSRRIERFETFAAKGFIREIGDTVVARSNAFDVYRAGERYKHVITRTSGVNAGEIIVHVRDGEGTWQWSRRGRLQRVSPMELGMLRFRYPLVLSWIREKGRAPEAYEARAGEREYRLRYRHEDMLLTLAVDRGSRLLDRVEVQSSSDSTFLFVERYANYTDLDGAPFPQRHAASYRGAPLYEYVLSFVEIRSEIPDSLLAITSADTSRAVR